MKRYLYFLGLLLSACVAEAQRVGGVRDLRGQTIPLDSPSGKKLLIVILPTIPDTALMGQITRFGQRHARQITILGIIAHGAGPSMADSSGGGYVRLRQTGVWLTQGMAATDSASSIRQSVLRYLSAKSRNRQTDRLAEGAKYFLSEKGRLFAQLGSHASLDSPVADYLLQTKVPGEDRF
jgi:hypothetical protein